MSVVDLLQSGCLIVFVLALLSAAWQDLRTLHIGDAASLVIVVAFAVWALAGLLAGTETAATVALALAGAAAIFVCGVTAFAVGLLGGGDVKLLAASSLFAGQALMMDFLMVVALAGGAMGVAVLTGAVIGPAATADDGAVEAHPGGRLPYGPAIAGGGVWVAASLGSSPIF